MSLELDFRTMPKWMPESIEIMALIDTWARAYEVPREAILRQIPIAYAWVMSNKNKAPKKQVIRYLFNFMRKAKEFGNLKSEAPKPAPAQPDPEPDLTLDEMRAIRQKNFPQYRADPCKFNNVVDTEEL